MEEEKKKQYQEYVEKISPKSPILKNILLAFLVGGTICVLGQFFMDFYANTSPEFGFYHEQREMMTGKYYPLEFGSFDKNKILAMQFTTDDASAGEVFIYKRSNVRDDKYTVKLNGLNPTAEYKIYDYDNPEKFYAVAGVKLMNGDFTIPLPEGEKAIILMFSAE